MITAEVFSMRDIGKNIRDLRERSGLTQEALAEKLFVTRQTVSNYETGKTRPDLDMLIRIAETLGCDANTVLYGIPQSPERKRTIKRVAITGSIFLVLLVAHLILRPIANRLATHSYSGILSFFVGWILSPTIWTMAGICLMELFKLALIPQLRPIPGAKWIRLGVWVIWGFCLTLLLGYWVMIIVADIQAHRFGSSSISLPLGAVLDWLLFRLMQLARYASPVFVFPGMLYSLLLPQQETN